MGIPDTWDSYTNRRVMQLHPEIREDVAKAINDVRDEHGIKLRIGKDGHFRKMEEQRELYERHKNGGPLAAPPGKSYHNYGLAVDLYIIEDGQVSYDLNKYQKVADIFEKYGFSWGYALWGKDKPHFQKTFGYDQSTLKKQLANTNAQYPKIT